MLHKYGKRTLDFLRRFFFFFSLANFLYFGSVFEKTIILLALLDMR